MPNVTTTPATIEVQITAVKSLVSQGMLTPEQGLARMAAIHSSAAGNGNGAKSGAAVPADEERKPPRVARTPMVLAGPSQDELLRMLAAGDITVEDFKAASLESSGKISLNVGPAGWLGIYSKGMQRPISMPVEMAEVVFSEPGAAAVRAFIATNSAHFSRK